MCGVCGIYHYRDGVPADPAVLRAMNDSLVHRGPDDEGAHLEGALGLAMRRLAIVDPASGQQPLYSEDGQIVLVANGEIYNSPALRAELSARGHTFRSGSDCEVIVHLYEELGPECLQRLQGMFGLALYDRKRRRLLLARDRLGIKPLYYADVGGTLRFGSEIKALLQDPDLPRRLDPRGVHHYLSLNYVPAPYTLLRGVRQLLPGELLLCDAAGVQRRSYWDLRFGDGDATLGEEEWARRLREKLAACVGSHLMSDVPFGAFLSGGIDSSAVVGLMTEALGGPVQTFSVDFSEKSYSEARYAQLVADRFGSQHHLLQASPTVAELLPALIWHADDPLADSSMLPVYLVSEFARRRVTMVQTGDGADELFAGYETYQAHYIRRLYRMVPGWIRRRLIAEAVARLPVSLTKVSLDFKAKRFVAGAELDAEAAHFSWRQILSESAKMELYSDGFVEQLREAEREHDTLALYRGYFERSGSDHPLDRMLYVDSRFYLPSDMLVKVDRMTMANALEARVPFLDHELAELAASIPASIKFSRLRKKHVLKQALRGLLPDEILYRKKAGFNVPVNAWLAGELRGLSERVLAPEQLERVGCFRPAVVRRMLTEHQQRRADHSFALWGLICLQLWHARFVEPATVEPPAQVARRWSSHLRPERAAPWPDALNAS